jgi:hypothetical protein
MKAASLTNTILRIFDQIEVDAMYGRINSKFSKIVNDIKASMYRNVPQSDKILIDDVFKLDVNTLRQILGDKFDAKDLGVYSEFIAACRKESNRQSIVSQGGTYPSEEKTGRKRKYIKYYKDGKPVYEDDVDETGPWPTKEKPEQEMGRFKKELTKEWDKNKPIKFTDDFWQMLDKLGTKVGCVWDLYSLAENENLPNTFGIEEVDISDTPYSFDIIRNGRKSQIKIGQFIRNFFGGSYSVDELAEFTREYNKLMGSVTKGYIQEDFIKVREFRYEPTNVKETFISLTTETYPHGHEEEVVKYIQGAGLSKDKFGNYYKIIGHSDTVFTCHLDTASRTKDKINLIEYQKDGDTFIKTDGSTILGADDKAGCTVMLYMIANNVPGVYWFFIGEERGGIGSGQVASEYYSYSFMQGKKKMVSFDRRNYYSVITSQFGAVCCSNEFGESLCKELNKSGLKLNLDPTGVFTDSANFVDYIPECTNVSVGYFSEHQHTEIQNISYLERLAKAAVACNWDKLVVKRNVGYSEEVTRKYSKILKKVKKSYFYNKEKIKGIEGNLVIDLKVTDKNMNNFYRDMVQLQELMDLHKLDPDVTFDGAHLKIELK